MKGLFSLLAGVLLAAGSAQAQTFSLAGDWNSTTDSATNLWAYGTFSAGTTFVVPSTAANSGSTVNFWTFPPVGDSDTSDPNIEKNLGSSASFSSNAEFRAGEVSFGPYQGPAVAQFTVPTAGTYTVSATFQTDQIRNSSTGDGTTAYVYIGGLDAYTQILSDPGAAQFGTAVTFTSGSIALAAGEKVDFAVGGGAFTTQVDATLSEAPEPSTWLMMTGGLAIAGLITRRRMARAL